MSKINSKAIRESALKEKSVLDRNAVSLVINGQKTIRFAEKAVNTNDREIHFLSSGNCISSFDIEKQTQFESILIFFDDKVLSDFVVDNTTLIEKEQQKYNPEPARYISIPKDDFINTYIQSLRLIATNKKKISTQMKRLKLWELLLYLLETARKGYYNNRFEAEARSKEEDLNILDGIQFI